MSRDEFTCQYCFNSESTLNVHHNYYENGKDPWDYPDTALVTLCESCHQYETENRKSEEALLLSILKHCGFTSSNIHGLACAFSEGFSDSPTFGDFDEWCITEPIRKQKTLFPILKAIAMQKPTAEDAELVSLLLTAPGVKEIVRAIASDDPESLTTEIAEFMSRFKASATKE